MQFRNRLFWLLRPETFILVVLPILAIILLALLGMFNSERFGAGFWMSLVYLQIFGWGWSCLIGGIALGYLALSVVVWAIQRSKWNSKTAESLLADHPMRRSVDRIQAAASLARLIALYALACVLLFLALNALCQPNYQKVLWANQFLMEIDHKLFGTYVPFEAQEQPLFHFFSALLLNCYLYLNEVFLLVLLALCVFNYKRFRHYCLAFIACVLLAFPGWYAIPAITPDEAYRLNKPRAVIPLDISMELTAPIYHLNPDVAKFLRGVEPHESAPSQGIYLVTSLPSMHVAWGMLAVWFGCKLWRRSVLFLAPWGALNAIAAVFTLQHYAIDVIAGMVVTVLAVLLVQGLLTLEARRGLSPPKGYEIAGFILSDLRALLARLPVPARVGNWLCPTHNGAGCPASSTEAF
jgi:membrane-associated phospholipid phosphatase